MTSGHGAVAGFPIAVEGAGVANKGGDSGDGGEEEVIGAPAFQIEGETALGDLAAQHGVADLQLVEVRSQRALRHQFDEKLEGAHLIRRRDDGIGTFDALVLVIHTQCRVLAGLEGEWPSGIHANPPQIFREILSFDDSCRVVLVRGKSHA